MRAIHRRRHPIPSSVHRAWPLIKGNIRRRRRRWRQGPAKPLQPSGPAAHVKFRCERPINFHSTRPLYDDRAHFPLLLPPSSGTFATTPVSKGLHDPIINVVVVLHFATGFSLLRLLFTLNCGMCRVRVRWTTHLSGAEENDSIFFRRERNNNNKPPPG